MDDAVKQPERAPARGPRLSWQGAWAWLRTAEGFVVVFLLALTALRVGVLQFTFINLVVDEAQYWAWSQHLAFGYVTKPPMIAWLIAGTTAVCGDGEACVRLSSPLLHGAIAYLVFLIGRALYDARTGLWAAIAFTTLPMVWFSTGIVSTDVPLAFFWAAALLTFHHLIAARAGGRVGDALKLGALLGFLIGLGMLSKYAMIYFVAGMLIYAGLAGDARRALVSRAGGLLLVTLLLTLAPNIAWNAQQSFATVEHTAANANWGAHLFNFDKLGEFLMSQVGVFGPVMTVMFLFGLLTFQRRAAGGFAQRDIFLLCFCIPILLIVLGQAFISRANANWAAPAYVAATVLVVAWILRARAKMFLNVSIIIHCISGAILYAAPTIPGMIEILKLENSFKRVRGWDTLGAAIERAATEGSYAAIVSDDREITAEITYYTRRSGVPVVMFDNDGHPDNQFELDAPYRRELDPVLYVTLYTKPPIAAQFERAELIETFRMERGGKYHFDFQFFRLSGYKE